MAIRIRKVLSWLMHACRDIISLRRSEIMRWMIWTGETRWSDGFGTRRDRGSMSYEVVNVDGGTGSLIIQRRQKQGIYNDRGELAEDASMCVDGRVRVCDAKHAQK